MMLTSRAKGTPLHGDAHAIFSLRTILASQRVAHHPGDALSASSVSRIDGNNSGGGGSGGHVTLFDAKAAGGGAEEDKEVAIGEREFALGLMEAILRDPNGHVAEWILKELQVEAAEWSTHRTAQPEDRMYYLHDSEGTTQVRCPTGVSLPSRLDPGRSPGRSPLLRNLSVRSQSPILTPPSHSSLDPLSSGRSRRS